MNELKPEDVMRALECCCVYCNCNGCPHFDGVPEDDCHYKVMVNALALLREKDAEIERLNAYIKRCKSGEEYWVKCLLERPKEVITEFAERAKRRLPIVSPSVFDKIAKELKEGEDGKTDL